MKHRLSLRAKDAVIGFLIAFALFLPCLAACYSTDTPLASDDTVHRKPVQSSAQTAYGEEASITEENYSCFEMPEETDTLMLYSGEWWQNKIFQKAIPIFERTYPDVDVVLNTYSADEYEAVIHAEIPAGKGPDLLFADISILPDIYKTMETGLFEDLNPYVENDAAFTLDDYVGGIMDAGILHGERFILPFSHRSMILTTTEEFLAEEGISMEEMQSTEDFCAVCERYRENHPALSCFDYSYTETDEMRRLTMLSDLYNHSGLQFFDYETGEVIVNRDDLKRICDLCRLYDNCPGTKETKKIRESANFSQSDVLLKRISLFKKDSATGLSFVMNRYVIRNRGETPVTFLLPDETGAGCTNLYSYCAILKNAKNKRNAWRFLKVLLSEEIQGDAEDVMRAMQPVHKRAAKDIVEYFGYPDPEIDSLIDAMNNIDRASIFPPVLWTYLRDNMMPYIKDNKDFDTCFNKLVSVLELYIDE